MTIPGATFRTAAGRAVALGKELGRGGEGIVFAVDGASDVAAKIYHPSHASERKDKIAAMVENGAHRAIAEAAFPIEALFDRSGIFAGFTMRRIGGRRPVHEAYSPTSRRSHFPRATFPYLVRVAANIAKAIAQVHSNQMVIGDINHSGVLVGEDATAMLIDTDSFQIAAKSKLFRCTVGVPDFTPPELQGKTLTDVIRTPNHDAFGLAVLIFIILFMGRHPFSGQPLSGDSPEVGDAIAKFRFAYSARRQETQMEPPPHVPGLAALPPALGMLFERAFGPQGLGVGRPSAADWVQGLAASEAQLQQCTSSKVHHFFKAASACPWCAMERAFPGFYAFAPVAQAFAPSTAVTLNQLIAEVQSVRDPGAAPDLSSLMPPIAGIAPSASLGASLATRQTHLTVATGCASAGISMLAATPYGGVGLLLAGAGVIIALAAPGKPTAVRASIQVANSAWAALVRQWSEAAGNKRFVAIKRDADNLIVRLQELQTEERQRLEQLSRQHRQTQLHDHLERHLIRPAKIKGLGSKRKIRLQSFGIESAADVAPAAVRNVPGCSSLVEPLMSWRRGVEARFVFNAAIPINPAAIATIRNDVGRRRTDLEARARSAVVSIRQITSEIETLRRAPGTAAGSAWRTLQQANADQLILTDFKKRLLRSAALVSIVPAAAIFFGSAAINRRLPLAALPAIATVAPVAQPQAAVAPATSLQTSAPMQRPTADLTPPSWSTKSEIQGGKTLSAADPSSVVLASLAFTCGTDGRILAAAMFRPSVPAKSKFIQLRPSVSYTIPGAEIPLPSREAYILINRVIEIGDNPGAFGGSVVVAGEPQSGRNLNPFRILPSEELRTLVSTCLPNESLSPVPAAALPGTQPSAAPLPGLAPAIDVKPAVGDAIPPTGVTIEQVPVTPAPGPSISRQQKPTTKERNRALTTGTGGLY